MKLYTAVGIRIEHRDGSFCVNVADGEKRLLGLEKIIWIGLVGNFIKEENIFVYIQNVVDEISNTHIPLPEKDVSYCLQRLITRGLVIGESGNDEQSIVYKMLSKAIVIPIRYSLVDRIAGFCVALLQGKGIRFASQIFRYQTVDKKKKQFVKMLDKSGDVQRYVKLIQDRDLLEEYGIHNLLKNFDQEKFLAEIQKLYHQRLIIIHKIGESEYEKAKTTYQ